MIMIKYASSCISVGTLGIVAVMLQSIPGAGEHPGLSALQNAVIGNPDLRLIVFSALRAFALSRSYVVAGLILILSMAPVGINFVCI